MGNNRPLFLCFPLYPNKRESHSVINIKRIHTFQRKEHRQIGCSTIYTHNKILTRTSCLFGTYHLFSNFKNWICALSTHFISWFKCYKLMRFTISFRRSLHTIELFGSSINQSINLITLLLGNDKKKMTKLVFFLLIYYIPIPFFFF